MISYRDPPWDPEAAPIVDATPKEVYGLRPALFACMRRWLVPDRDWPDLFQEAARIVCDALREDRVRGSRVLEPQHVLFSYTTGVAYNVWRNWRLHAHRREELLEDEHGSEAAPLFPEPRPEGRIEAREILRRIAERPYAVDMLITAAMEEKSRPERADDAGMKAPTYAFRLRRVRRWARDVAESGEWQEPPQPDPPTPRERKKKR